MSPRHLLLLLPVLPLGGCDPIDPMPPDLPCREAGYAPKRDVGDSGKEKGKKGKKGKKRGGGGAGGSESWFVPLSPPFVRGGMPSDWDDDDVYLDIGPLRMVNIDIEDYQGTSMRVTCETAQIGNAYELDAVMELER